jgi:glutamine synthetase
VPDGACNPYLAAAALLHACRFGVEDGLELQDPQPVGDPPSATIHVPQNLAAAVSAMEADTRLCEALGPELVRAFAMLKRAEWDRYTGGAGEDPASTEVTTWELAYYTPFF